MLAWVDKQEEWSIFVRNCVKEIREIGTGISWRHIPGQLNPADLLSRGCNLEQLVRSRWWEGPSWLKEGEESWPSACWNFDEEEVFAEKVGKTTTCLSKL